jgi:hypothetical protein
MLLSSLMSAALRNDKVAMSIKTQIRRSSMAKLTLGYRTLVLPVVKFIITFWQISIIRLLDSNSCHFVLPHKERYQHN